MGRLILNKYKNKLPLGTQSMLYISLAPGALIFVSTESVLVYYCRQPTLYTKARPFKGFISFV